MALIKCPKGWLVVPTDDGQDYVPFFVQVRNQDIHWKENSVITNYLKNNTVSGVDSLDRVEPGYIYRIDRNNWSIDMQCDGLVTATTQITIDDTFMLDDVNNTVLSKMIELPLFLKDDKYFNIQTTLSPAEEDMEYAVANVSSIVITTSVQETPVNGYDSFVLNINSPIYRFSDKYASVYKNSKIFITVRGNVPSL